MSGELRRLERDSIYAFIESCGDLFKGARVLDYGCGQQPYKDLIESFGPERYEGYDKPHFPGSVVTEQVPAEPVDDPIEGWDVLVCTQVLQYVPMPGALLSVFTRILRPGGALVLTWPTSWPEVEITDLHRFTSSGMRWYLMESGFTVVERLERRAEIEWHGERFALGYGAVARA